MSGDPKHPELIPFTFENGVQVWLRKVPPLLINQLAKTFPPPKPPLEEVDFGEGPKLAANEASDTHKAALLEYYAMQSERITEMLWRVGIKYELTDDDRASLAYIREQMHELGVTLPADEKLAFIGYVCIGSQGESDRLRAAILRRSQPTEEAVQDAVDSFRGDVRGEGSLSDQGAEERGEIREPVGVGIGADS